MSERRGLGAWLRNGRLVPRWIFLLVFVAGAGHSLLYAVSFPPFAIEDEQQHVDYTWRLAFEQRLPHIDEPVDQSVIEALAGSERWESYGMSAPAEPSADALGLQARSYAAYHPPLYYAVTTPVAWAVGDRALVLMYALRALNAALAGAVCALTAWLAARWAPGPLTMTAALVAGLTLAALPALADSGGRHNADLAAAAVVVATALAADAWRRTPSDARVWWVAGLLGSAVLTRETALVAVVPVGVAAVSLHRRRALARRGVAHIAAVAVGAGVVTLAVVRATTGSIDGSRAFLDLYGVPYPDLSWSDVGQALARHALLPFGQWSGTVTTLAVAAAVTLASAGLVLAARCGLRLPTVVAWGVLGSQLAILALSAARGLNIPTARLLLPSYPLLAAWLAAAFASPRNRLAYAPAIVSIAVGATFFLHDLAPHYPFRLG